MLCPLPNHAPVNWVPETGVVLAVMPHTVWVPETTSEAEYGLTAIEMADGDGWFIVDDWVGERTQYLDAKWHGGARGIVEKTLAARRARRADWAAAAGKVVTGITLDAEEQKVVKDMSYHLSYLRCGRRGNVAKAVESAMFRQLRQLRQLAAIGSDELAC